MAKRYRGPLARRVGPGILPGAAELPGPEPRQTNLAGGLRGVCFQEPVTDPQGSWTGVPAEPYESPVQDVDDL